jgi:hypothetical protein
MELTTRENKLRDWLPKLKGTTAIDNLQNLGLNKVWQKRDVPIAHEIGHVYSPDRYNKKLQCYQTEHGEPSTFNQPFKSTPG